MKLNRIKAVLEEKGISQTWLSKKMGKSFSTVNAYVCNRTQPNLTTLLEIAQILSVDMKELIVLVHLEHSQRCTCERFQQRRLQEGHSAYVGVAPH